MMLAASDDHIHGAGVGVGEEKRRAVEEMKRKKNTGLITWRKQGVLMTSIMCARPRVLIGVSPSASFPLPAVCSQSV
jgi:hypothetical protein